MLSIENPPPDPPCPCEISPLKSSDERVFDDKVDLLKSGFDHDNNSVVLPKFSIRDYVFSVRSKDIKTNWPFSQKNLQQCLEHGVKDLLPPFQHIDSAKNWSVKRCTVESSMLDEENINNFNGKPFTPTCHLDTISSDNAGFKEKLAADCDIGGVGSEREKEIPSTTSSQPHSRIDSTHCNRTHCSELKTDPSLKVGAIEPEAVSPLASNKKGSTTQPPFKKCKLTVKLCSIRDPSSNEDMASNCMTFSQTMTSKVCPVCKTFSSSSNTTLNAHIDQCLSVESTIKWTADCKMNKHRIKPRKTRLMVDIYATALRCTLEELDKRNGTCWAINSNLPTQETELCARVEKRQRVSPVSCEDTDNEGAVYVDANGKKVRILSEFNKSTVSKAGVVSRFRKVLKSGKGSILTIKKKHRGQKHKKYLKLVSQRNIFCYSKAHCGSEIRRGQEKTCAVEEKCDKEEYLIPFNAQEKIKPSDSGTIRNWVCSKRTGFTKKTTSKEGIQHLGHNLTQGLLVESDLLSQSQYAFSSKATRFSSLKKDILSLKRSSVPESNCSLRGKRSALKKSRVHLVEESDQEVAAWTSEVIEHDSMQNHPKTQSRVEDITDKVLSLGRRGVLKIRKKRAASISQREEAVVLKSSNSASQYCGHDMGNKRNSSVRVGKFDVRESAGTGIQTHWEDIVVEPSSSRIAFGESVMSLSRSSDREFNKLSSPSYTQSNSMQCIKVCKGSLCGSESPISPQPRSGDGQEMFYANAVGEGMIGLNIHKGRELDCEVGQGNCFSVDDPISIPGPPGSFLPSPGDIGAEELQGNSSSTSSQVQITEDYHDLLDRDSSDSPISATSTISNSTLVTSDSKSLEQKYVGAQVTLDDIRSGFSGSSHDTEAENISTVLNTATMRIESNNLDELKVNAIFPNKGPLNLKNDQPCCCSRKEGTSQGVALNHQESQLPIQRNMAPVTLAMGKQMSCDLNKRPSYLNSRPEMLTLSNFPSSKSENVANPIMNSPAGLIPKKVFSANSGLKFPTDGDFDFARVPSASTPVLRLMGKNLMVVNKDENLSPRLTQAQSAILNNHPNSQFQTFAKASPGNVQNREFHSFDYMVHQNPHFGQNQHNTMGQGFDVRFSNSFRSHVDGKYSTQTPIDTSAAMFPNENVGGGEPHDYKGVYNFPDERKRSKKKFVTTPDHPQNRNANSSPSLIKDIIIIDDSPESEPDSATDATTYSEGTQRSWVSSAGSSIPMASDYSSRHVNSFYSCSPHDCSPGGSPMLYSPSFQMPPSRRANAIPVKWNCTLEGSSILHPSSLTAPLSSTGHQRSALYYSPSLS
ncbi:uncharacterized protein LOC132308287 [Cornus florida]|uniref:uncharacterized protein LOC132308287 n=1 Tax=Cornus florida TaxID=4283 RepID=UPI00289E12E3|nr:uncharacterized protein LOC132308287 [Cornus florida]XP_059662310.1 uncharacterized protein LOC132308287 [Cornus florida]XP_059662311.1 uncharacterized protein LOC132308287 [Cornus florida]